VYTDFVWKNITFSAHEEDIRAAREKALRHHQTLNEAFRQWLRSYAHEGEPVAKFRDLMSRLQHVDAGRKFTRDEMNER
jgi:hypothetical protein